MESIEFRARCPRCKTERSLVGPLPARTPAELDLMEAHLTGKTLVARCPQCDQVEAMAMFVDGVQTEPWQNADEAERQHGRNAGPLRRKPWPDTN